VCSLLLNIYGTILVIVVRVLSVLVISNKNGRHSFDKFAALCVGRNKEALFH